MVKKARKGFTLIELIVTLGVTGILIAILSTFIVFTNNVSNEYRESLYTVHSAYNMESALKSFIEKYNDGKLEIRTFDSKIKTSEDAVGDYEYGKEYCIVNHNTENDQKFSIYFYRLNETKFPELRIRFGTSIGTTDDNYLVLFKAQSNLGLLIEKSTFEEGTNKDPYIGSRYKFSIYYVFKTEVNALSFTEYLRS